MTIKAVIFDMDGTLTEPLLDFDVIRREIGFLPDGAGILESLHAMAPWQRVKAHAVLAAHEQAAAEQSTLNDGAAELLKTLHADGVSVGILTRNTRQSAFYVTQKHNLHYDGLVCREDGPPKPDAYGVRWLCHRFGAAPAQTLVVGDFKHDLEAARSAGAISVLLKNHAKADTFEHLADYVIIHLGEIHRLIKTFK